MHNNDHDPHGRDADRHHDLGGNDHDDAERALDPQQSLIARPPDKNQPATNPTIDESLIDESLHHALSDLEQILERHEGSEARVARADTIDEGTQQYVIPLLDEVVIPGTEGYASPPMTSVDKTRSSDDGEPALRRRLAERLASEIEVITQDRIEAALETAREEIRVQIRNHLDIILPEIVEELNQLRRRPTRHNSDND